MCEQTISKTQIIIALDDDSDDDQVIDEYHADLSDSIRENLPLSTTESNVNNQASSNHETLNDENTNNDQTNVDEQSSAITQKIITETVELEKQDLIETNENAQSTEKALMNEDQVMEEEYDKIENDYGDPPEKGEIIDYEDDDYDDEAEFCMIIEDITDKMETRSSTRVSTSSSDDITFVGEKNLEKGNNNKPKEIVDIDDDDDNNDDEQMEETNNEQNKNDEESDDECVIIEVKKSDNSRFNKNNRGNLTLSSGLYPDAHVPSTSKGIGSQPSFIPLYQPNEITLSNKKSRLSDVDDYSSNYATFSKYADAMEALNKASQSFNSSQISVSSQESRPSTSRERTIDLNVSGTASSQDAALISQIIGIDKPIIENVLNLVEDECTVPFIVRYRQSYVSGLSAEKVREITTAYNQLKKAQERAKEVEQLLRKQEKLNTKMKIALNRCKTVYEVENLYRLCCNESDHCALARNYGLETSAMDILNGKPHDPIRFVNTASSSLNTIESVNKGWESIIVDVISKDCDVLEFIIQLCKEHIPTMEIEINPNIIQITSTENDREMLMKYQRFASFRKPISQITAHCLMAIERGEKLKFLLIYIEFKDILLKKLLQYCTTIKWPRASPVFLNTCIKKAWKHYLKPSIATYIRWNLRNTSHLKALEVFSTNVKHLLLEAPLRGEFVLGVDPGLDSGCKIAMVSPWGVYIEHDIVKIDSDHNCNNSAFKMKKMLQEYNCSIIALGNGTGCRKFEQLILEKIKFSYFKPIDVRYKIVAESGVSWYSVTQEAKREYPDLSPSIIGAITIARRLQDPLSELVKADPKRLQVGMYMNDIDEDLVMKAFNEVATECVSFCGVDVNTASFAVLSKVAGLGPHIAQKIIDKRIKDGPFNSRSQLKNIDGLGWKEFEQCAGFVKIMPETSGLRISPTNQINKRLTISINEYDPLDSTVIHPESYSSAETFLGLINSNKEELGKQVIFDKIKSFLTKNTVDVIAQLCNTNITNMQLIINSLQQRLDYDFRNNLKPIYIPEIRYFFELKNGTILKGRVMNVTPMGAFIDCGIAGGINAYVPFHESNKHKIQTNQVVQVKIISIDKQKQRFRVTIIKIVS